MGVVGDGVADLPGVDVGLRELALFAGAGGGILGGHLLGWRTVCAVELEPYAASVLAARQNDGLLAPFPVWDDVRTFDGRPWRGRVDVVSGGFPCQDISAAGKGVGIDGERSGLWSEFARIIGEVRPRFAFVENSPMLTSRGLGRVLGDLAALGMDARWGVLGAIDAGAPHERERIWVVAWDTNRKQQNQKPRVHAPECAISSGVCAEMADSNRLRQSQPQGGERDERGWIGNGSTDVPHTLGLQHKGPSHAEWWTGSAELLADADFSQRKGNQRQEREEHADIGRSGWWQSKPNVG